MAADDSGSFTYATARQFLHEFGNVRVDLVRIDRLIIYERLRHELAS